MRFIILRFKKTDKETFEKTKCKHLVNGICKFDKKKCNLIDSYALDCYERIDIDFKPKVLNFIKIKYKNEVGVDE